MRIPTPKGATPPTCSTAKQLVGLLGPDAEDLPIGVCFPAVVKNGVTLSAANISDEWIGLDADGRFGEALGRDIRFVNDADAAGLAELKFGAARDQPGFTIMTTLGTGIGSAFLFDGKLVPNSELGHLEHKGESIERWASAVARERDDISWSKWAKRLQHFYDRVEALFSPTSSSSAAGCRRTPRSSCR